MPTELTRGVDSRTSHLQRMEASFEELNARIARLAIALGVSLENENELARVMHQLQGQTESHSVQSTPERRHACNWTELRGLLVLRYGMEKRLVDEVGVTVTRQLLVEAEAHLVRLGFQPGADGLDLPRLFSES
jgi:hypothetical protein